VMIGCRRCGLGGVVPRRLLVLLLAPREQPHRLRVFPTSRHRPRIRRASRFRPCELRVLWRSACVHLRERDSRRPPNRQKLKANSREKTRVQSVCPVSGNGEGTAAQCDGDWPHDEGISKAKYRITPTGSPRLLTSSGAVFPNEWRTANYHAARAHDQVRCGGQQRGG
jgi:hypothetical protein